MQKGYNELILHDKYVTEGLSSNVFCISGGIIFTARAATVLGGATREAILRICQQAGIQVEE